VVLDPDDLLDSLAKQPGLSHLQSAASINTSLAAIFAQQSRPFLFIVSLPSVYAILNSDTKKQFEDFIQGRDLRQLPGLVCSAEPERFSSFSYEPWFRELTSSGSGLWLGDGINSQTTLKINNLIPSRSAALPSGFDSELSYSNCERVGAL
jgi:hypothetical protein